MPYEYKCKFLALTRGKTVFMSGGHDIMLREANVKLALSLTKNHFHFSAKKTLFDKFQKYVSLPPTPTHLTPLESSQKVSKNVTNVTGDMISGKYA